MLIHIHIIIYTLFNAICLGSITTLYKNRDNNMWKLYLRCFAGASVGITLSLLIAPINISNILLFALMGGAFGEVLTLFFLTAKQLDKKDTIVSFYDDGSPAKFFITGDKHRKFDRVKAFCRQMNTRRKDVLIILGDAGFNYYDDKRDDDLKKEISQLSML